MNKPWVVVSLIKLTSNLIIFIIFNANKHLYFNKNITNLNVNES